ncbi:transposase [Streptomyces chattanoogensis]
MPRGSPPPCPAKSWLPPWWSAWHGARPGTEFITATSGDPDAFGSPERLACFAGLAPQPREAGCNSGNVRSPPRRYHHRLLRTMYVSTRRTDDIADGCTPSG